jgi:hypothetical protein
MGAKNDPKLRQGFLHNLEGLGLVKDVCWKGKSLDNNSEFYLRDAGIDVNVPFPSALRTQPDIILVMDASEGAQGNEELAVAVSRGYLEVPEDEPKLHVPFG